MCLEGGDQTLSAKVAIFNLFRFEWSFRHNFNMHNTYQASMQRVYEQRKVKHATCKNVKGRVWKDQTQLETRMFLSWFRQVVLSYIHVDGDFNPRRVTAARVHGGLHPKRVTVARVHEGLHPRRVHEEATLSIPPWSLPMKGLPHSGRSSRSRRSPCPYKLIG